MKRLSLLATVIVASGCIGHSATSDNAASQRRGGVTTLVLVSQLKDFSIDPASAYSPGYGPLLAVTNDGLVGYRRTSGAAGDQLVPDLATSIPDPTDGGRTWAFQVRPGIHYSTGQRVVASDFRRAIERDFMLHSPGLFAMRGIVGADACSLASAGCSLQAGVATDDDAGTVTFHLTEPDFEFPFKLALPMTDPLPSGTPNSLAIVTPLPATGPYRIATFQPGSRMVLERNAQFHEWSAEAQPDGYADRIVIRLGLSRSAAFTAVASAEAAAAWGFNRPSNAQLAALENTTAVTRNPMFSMEYIFLNAGIPPFDHLAARRAVSTAIDRQRLASAVRLGFDLLPTCQVLPPGFPGYRRSCPSGVPDLAAARRLVLASGTWGTHVGVVSARAGASHRVGVELVRMLDRIGYRASLRIVAPAAEYTTDVDSRNHVQVGIAGWFADYPSPANFFNPLLSCADFIPNSSENYNASEFCDPAIDAAVRRAVAAGGVDPASAAPQWAAIDRRVTTAAPIVPLFSSYQIGLASRSARNVVWNHQWSLLFDLMRPR